MASSLEDPNVMAVARRAVRESRGPGWLLERINENPALRDRLLKDIAMLLYAQARVDLERQGGDPLGAEAN